MLKCFVENWIKRSRGDSRMPLYARTVPILAALGWLAVLITDQSVPAANPGTAPSATLIWDRNPEFDVVEYRIYYGTASRRYTGVVSAGNSTSGSVYYLSNGIPYFFAVTAVDATGLESDYSQEVVITPGTAKVKVRIASNRQAVLTVSGQVGNSYDILASTNLSLWGALGSVTLGSNGQATFTDTAAPNFKQRSYKARLRP